MNKWSARRFIPRRDPSLGDAPSDAPSDVVLFTQVGARIGEALRAVDMSTARRRYLFKRVLQQARDTPPEHTTTLRAQRGAWQTLVPGITINVVRSDAASNNMTAFIRMQPGASLSTHRHSQHEECMVLEGEIMIGAHRVGTGDMHIAGPNSSHECITAPMGALLLIRAEIPPASYLERQSS